MRVRRALTPRPERSRGLAAAVVALPLVVLLATALAAVALLPRAAADLADAAVSTAATPGPVTTDVAALALEAVAEGVERRTVTYGPGGEEQQYDVYSPAGEPAVVRPTVLFLHGGSWEIGDKVEYVDEAVEVARRGWTAVSVNYRRTPTAPWPAPLDDARAALGHLQQHAAGLGVDVDRTGAVGDSVGAQLAALLGRPVPGLVPVRAVVAWSGVNDMTGLLRQRASGGCPNGPCAYSGLVRKVVQDLMRCTPAACPDAYREASPAAGLTAGPATFSVNGEQELIDPRQAWAIDSALSRVQVTSRVRVLAGGVHGRGNQAAVWQDSLRFLAAALLPETADPFPRPEVTVTRSGPATVRTAVGRPVRLHGAVRPRALGSSAALQVRSGDGSWRTLRTLPLAATPADTVYDTAWTPTRPGTTVLRVLWRGGGGQGTSPLTTVRAVR